MPHTDTASRVIRADAHRLFEALVDPGQRVQWLPPAGMTGTIEAFEARVGGGYRMTLTYDVNTGAGKSTSDSDVVDARFVELVPGSRVVEAIAFASDDPAHAGTMLMSWALAPTTAGTDVTVTAEQVPDGIDSEVHVAALDSTLAQLAALVER